MLILCLFIGLSSHANLAAERLFYQRYLPYIQSVVPVLDAKHTAEIQALREGDVTGYFDVLFEAWRPHMSHHEERALRNVHVRFVEAEDHPSLSFRARADGWNTVGVLLPRRLRHSILYHYLKFHELEHCRQSCAFFEGTDHEMSELIAPTHFWARFEREKSAMSMEWFFLHHMPVWARESLARDLASITVRDAWIEFAERALANAHLPLADFLQSQWSAGRYSWQACSEMIAD